VDITNFATYYRKVIEKPNYIGGALLLIMV